MRVRSVRREYEHWLVTLVPARDGIDFSSLVVRPSLLIDRQEGYVLNYRRWAVPPIEGPSVATARAFDAQTLVGAHLGSTIPGISWTLSDARLVWLAPAPHRLVPDATERARRLSQEGRAGLFYEIVAFDPLSAHRPGRSPSIALFVHVDALDGSLAALTPFQTFTPAPAAMSLSHLPRVPHGPATVSIGGRSVETHRAAIWWVHRKAPVSDRLFLVVTPRAVLTVGFDPATGLVTDSRTGFLGVPSPSLRRALERLAEGQQTHRRLVTDY
jgi:hypothetical protein